MVVWRFTSCNILTFSLLQTNPFWIDMLLLLHLFSRTVQQLTPWTIYSSIF